jgi:hypothetical protein
MSAEMYSCPIMLEVQFVIVFYACSDHLQILSIAQ